MAEWPANGDTDWNTKMLAYLAVGHATDGLHNQAGLTAQVVNTQTGAVATGTTAIPQDNTIPQITEGDEYMTLSVTPKNASNKLKIDVVWNGDVSGVGTLTVALFQDSTADSIAVGVARTSGDGSFLNSKFTHYMAAGTTSPTTFRIRAGGSSGTTTFNGSGGSGLYGGVMASSITITEIWV